MIISSKQDVIYIDEHKSNLIMIFKVKQRGITLIVLKLPMYAGDQTMHSALVLVHTRLLSICTHVEAVSDPQSLKAKA